MGIGKRRDTPNIPLRCNFDATGGKMNRWDREQDEVGNWHTNQTDITQTFEAIFDLENMEIGYIAFPRGGHPDFRMVSLGTDIGKPPSDNHKEGFRLRMKLTNGAGDDVREFASTSKMVWKSVDELHDEYLEGSVKHRGKLPIVGIAEVAQVRIASRTFYRPIFEITGWAKRPNDLTK
jgi:hypothetical protein